MSALTSPLVSSPPSEADADSDSWDTVSESSDDVPKTVTLRLARCGLPGESEPVYPLGHYTSAPSMASQGVEHLLVREVAMMKVMDEFTDRPDWHRQIFDDEVAAKWAAEALEIPAMDLYREVVGGRGKGRNYGLKPLKRDILDQECMDWCVKELREKVRLFETTDLIPTLEACAMVIKSDTLIDPELHSSIRGAFAQLIDDRKGGPDWQPGTYDMVDNIVDPSMYPFVRGRTSGFPYDQNNVGVADAVDKWAGKGRAMHELNGDPRLGPPSRSAWYWSGKYQWLPSEIRFLDGDYTDGVRITSYINNLHPIKYPGIYDTIEKLLGKVFPAWDMCHAWYDDIGRLVGPGRLRPRYHHADRVMNLLSRVNRHDPRFWDRSVNPKPRMYPWPGKFARSIGQHWEPPSPNDLPPLDDAEKERIKARHGDRSGYHSANEEDPWNDCDDADADPKIINWVNVREPVYLEFPQSDPPDYSTPEGDRLREVFHDKRLQIIVKMTSIELTPEKPRFPGGHWHVDGLLNEHIVATAVYYPDSENITTSRLAFRALQGEWRPGDWDGVVEGKQWGERVFGHSEDKRTWKGEDFQNYGSVETGEGRLVVYPNRFHTKASPFELVDMTRPGHQRMMVLHLLNPFMNGENRPPNTATVPPQQQDWWMDSVFPGMTGSDAAKMRSEVVELLREKAGEGAVLPEVLESAQSGGLPAEVTDLIREAMGEVGPMIGVEEARRHRRELILERIAMDTWADDEWGAEPYSCHHEMEK